MARSLLMLGGVLLCIGFFIAHYYDTHHYDMSPRKEKVFSIIIAAICFIGSIVAISGAIIDNFI